MMPLLLKNTDATVPSTRPFRAFWAVLIRNLLNLQSARSTCSLVKGRICLVSPRRSCCASAIIQIYYSHKHQLMTYGKILFNNIKEYTPKWYPTIPYSQTVKPVYGRKPQVVSNFNANPNVKKAWRGFNFVFMRQTWMFQVFIVFCAFASFHLVYDPYLMIYRSNNTHRTYQAAIKKERAHKQKLREQEEAEEAAEQ